MLPPLRSTCAPFARGRKPFVAAAASLLLACSSSSGVPARSPEAKESAGSASTFAGRAADHLPEALTNLGSDTEGSADPGAPDTIAVPIVGSDLVHGRSTVKVSAPLERVREAVLSFGEYADFMPHYRNCRVLGRTPSGARDVYMEVTALHGAVRMWARVEVPKPAHEAGVETYDTKFMEGNVRDFEAIWRLRKLDAQTTELSLEVFLHPSIPLPTTLLNEENLSGSAKGVAAMKARAEGRSE